jgi:glucose dehydrogenase
MKPRLIACLGLATLLAIQAFGAFSPRMAAQSRTAATTVDWPLHNLDLAGTRFSPMDQINRSNVKSLTPRWLFQHGVIDGVSNQTTPVPRGSRELTHFCSPEETHS